MRQSWRKPDIFSSRTPLSCPRNRTSSLRQMLSCETWRLGRLLFITFRHILPVITFPATILPAIIIQSKVFIILYFQTLWEFLFALKKSKASKSSKSWCFSSLYNFANSKLNSLNNVQNIYTAVLRWDFEGTLWVYSEMGYNFTRKTMVPCLLAC